MIENYIEKETDEVIEQLKQYISLEGLKKAFTRENYLAKERFEVEISHQYLDEISRFLHDGYQMNIPSLVDMDELFLALEKGSTLSVLDLYNVSNLLAESQYLYDLLQDKKQYEHLNDDALDLNPVISLKRELSQDIMPDFTLSDSSSIKLKEIRSRKHDLERSLSSIMGKFKNKYSSYLASETLALKGDEETLAVKACYKNMVKGTILSYSASGETAFMIPYEVIDLRNQIRGVIDEENQEINKILADLSQKCKKALKEEKRDYEIIMNFDRYLASVRYGNSYQGVISRLSDKKLELNQVFHPLLKATKVITNSISLGNDNPRCLVITGPNAGGKSIFIKAVGLSFMMDKLGLLVPCKEDAEIPFVDHVFFLGGDNQSVLDNLSTFSSHLVGIKEITEKATKYSLVIIDEVGEGTSPKDGESLGVALLKYFEKLGCFTLLTSHFDGLKFYAAEDKNTLTGAMEFNLTSLTPTYRILLNTTGQSYGLLLAKKIGLKEEILNDAKDFQNQMKNRDVESLMEKLSAQQSENERIQRQLISKKNELDRALEKREKAIKALNEERSTIHQKASEKVQKLVDQRLKEMDEIWKTSKQKENYSEFSKAKGELNKIKEVTSPTMLGKVDSVLDDIKVGDILEDEDGRRCKVLEVKKKEVLLDMDGLRFRRPIKGLKHMVLRASDIKKKPVQENRYDDIIDLKIDNSRGTELNIIGLHVDDAMREVVSFLDHARIKKIKTVRIIHGMGSFALKNAVWKYLANHKQFIKDYRLGMEGEGGLGATVVSLN